MSKCPDCMYEWDERMCANCGYRSGAPAMTPNALPVGTMLAERYALGNALGVSRQSIAYAAWDHQMNQRVIITEFYPAVIVKRVHGAVMPQRNQAQFQVAMNRYQAYQGQQALPMVQSFFGNNTAYRVYATAEQPQLKLQAEMLLDQPILFRDEQGRAQLTINALMIDPLPKERPYTKAGNPGKKKKQKALVAVFAMLMVLVVAAVIVLPQLGKQDVPVQGSLTAELPTTAPTTRIAAQHSQPPTKNPVTAPPVPTAIPATPRPTVVPMTPVPTATVVPTLEPSIELWYCKVNDKVFQIKADGSFEPMTADSSNIQFDLVDVSKALDDKFYYILKIYLRSEAARSQIDLADIMKAAGVDDDKDLNLELQSGEYTMILHQDDMFSRNAALADEQKLGMERELEISFRSGDGKLEYDKEAELDGWDAEFRTAQAWADTNVAKRDELVLSGDRFYAINGVYYRMNKSGSSEKIPGYEECFYVNGTEDSLKELKIPVYPVKVNAQNLDQNVFEKAILHADVDVDITDLMLNADGAEVFYLSDGSYAIDIWANPAFGCQVIHQENIHVGNQAGELPILDESALKAKVFADAGLWAYQLGENEPVICGVQMEQEKLLTAFGPLLQAGEFALRDVSFASAELAGKQLVFKSAKVSRGEVEIPLAELMHSPVELPVESLEVDVPVQENVEEEPADSMFVTASVPVEEPQAVVDNPDELVPINFVEGLLLTKGEYTFHPAENAAVQFNPENTAVVELGDRMQPVQKAMLTKIADNGMGYIGDGKNGYFIYQYSADEQMLFSAADMKRLNPEVLDAPKYTVSIDCTLQELTKEERASMGIVFMGKENDSSNPVELTFAVDAEMEKKQLVELAELAEWKGDTMTLILAPGSYRICYTSEDKTTHVTTTKYSDTFVAGADTALKLADRCEHNWMQETVKEATCTAQGTKMQVCTLCGEKGKEEIPIAAKGHDMKDATCTKPATCSRCGAADVSHHPALGHNWSSATCTVPKTCTRCNAIDGTALGHNYSNATCVKAATCTRCGNVGSPALGHAPGAAATCTNAQTCTRCNTQLAAALGHNPGTAATCTNAQTCTRCNTQLAAALGHAPGAAATCETAQTCTNCGKQLAAALGHSWGEWGNNTATCESSGIETRICGNGCGETETRQTSARGHNYDSYGKYIDPTCTDSGRQWKKCSCGKEGDWFPSGDPLGHSFVSTSATCTRNGCNARNPYYVESTDPPTTDGEQSSYPGPFPRW